MITGLNAYSFEHLQLGAGVFLKDFDPSTATDAAALKTLLAQCIANKQGLLGATKGGGTFQCKPSLRSIEADGLRSPVTGGTVNDGWTVKLTGTLLEIAPGSFAAVLGCADVTTSGSVTTIRPRRDVTADDHIPTLCWIGEMSQGLMLIQLTDALNMSGAAFTFTDKGEGTLPFEFQAHQSDPADSEHAPCRIMFFQ